MTIAQLTIEFPLPPPGLHAHAKGHWRGKAKLTKQVRGESRIIASQARAKSMPWKTARIHYRFFFPNRIRRDAANAIQSCKPIVDGIADAGLIESDDWEHLAIGLVECSVDKDAPRVELTLQQITT